MIEYRQLANILSLFLIVQLSGILIAFYLISPGEVAVVSSGPAASGQILFFFIYLIVAAVAMFFLFKFHHGPVLFIGIEGLVVVSATFYLLLIILATLFPSSGNYPVLVSFVAAIALIVAKNKWPGLRNFTAVVASVGVGLVMGTYFGFFAAFIFMGLIAVYDYVAVFITKHMVTLGRESVNRNLAFMVGSYDVEVVPKGYLKGKEEKQMNNIFKGTKSDTMKQLMKSGNVPVPSFSALGAGDLAIPLMLAVSAYITYFSYFFSLIIIFGASFGLVYAMYISKKYSMALPAIPPLLSFANIALGIDVLATAPANWELYLPLFTASVIILLLVTFTAKVQSKHALRISPA